MILMVLMFVVNFANVFDCLGCANTCSYAVDAEPNAAADSESIKMI